jgi:hypothetical protein
MGNRGCHLIEEFLLVELPSGKKASCTNTAETIQASQEMRDLAWTFKSLEVVGFDPAALEVVEVIPQDRGTAEASRTAYEVTQMAIHRVPKEVPLGV